MTKRSHVAFKPSGVESLGEVPSHWQVMRLKFLAVPKPFAIVDGPFGTQLKAEEYVSEGIPLVRVGDLDYSGNLSKADLAYISEEKWAELRRSAIEAGDVVVAKTGATIGKCGLVPDDFDRGLIASSCIKISPDRTKVSPKFLLYVLIAQSSQQQILLAAGGSTRDTINIEPFGSVRAPVPSIGEQLAIVAFLEEETARIDALIAAKERVLGVLAEKRRALITRAVTRGLDLRAPLRDSGSPWLGEIPAHWVATRLKFVADVRGGITIGQRYSTTDLIEMPYLRVANVQDGHLDLTEVATVLVPRDEAVACMLETGDVLMNEGGDADKLGRGSVWRGEIERCLHQNHVFAVRPRRVLSDWLNIWTSTDGAKAFFESRAKQSTNLASISATNINELPIPLPPPEEQSAIVDQVNDASAQLDVMRAATEKTILLLRERRAALITAAVAGQIELGSAA